MGNDKEEKQLVIFGGQNGFSCPVCHKFIPVSAKDLFQKVAIKCPSCSLSLTIDRAKQDNTEQYNYIISDADERYIE